MIYQGHVENGRIVLDDEASLPDGARVTVNVSVGTAPPKDTSENEAPSLYDRLKPFLGAAKGLPPDASENVDHYLYGHPKKFLVPRLQPGNALPARLPPRRVT